MSTETPAPDVLKPPAPDTIRAAITTALAVDGMSARELSRRTGVGSCKVSRFLAGKASLSLSNTERIMAELGIVVSRR